MAAIFPPENQGGVPPGPNVPEAYIPVNPVSGEGPLYASADCSTMLSADQVNGWTSELLAAVDRLGFSYKSTTVTNLGDALVARLGAKIERSGDTMTGPLYLSNHPITQPLQAVTKSYVDGNDSAIVAGVTQAYQIADAGLQSQIDTKVSRAGDTMTGPLILAAEPANPMEAATKAYVDAHAGSGGGGIPDAPFDGKTYGRKDAAWTPVLPIAGGTMAGAIVLPGDPVLALHATTKQYTDQQVSIAISNVDAKVAKIGDTMTGPLVLSGNPTIALHAAPKQYVDAADTTLTNNLAALTTTVTGKVAKAGDTMTGFLILSADPTATMHPATKQYVDAVSSNVNARVAKAGDTMSGFLTLNANPTTPLQAATKAYVDGVALGDSPHDTQIYGRQDGAWVTVPTSAAGSFLPLAGGTMTGPITLSGAPVSNLHAASKQYADGKIARTGDTMTGMLTLAGNPLAALDAVTKQYSDLNVAKAGSTMTGPLILVADPGTALGAATKQYVDGSVSGFNSQLANKVSIAGDTMTGNLTLNAGLIAHGTHSQTKWSADTVGPIFALQKSRGASINAYAAVQNGDILGQVGFYGSDATQMRTGAQLIVTAQSGPVSSLIPSRMQMSVANAAGVLVPAFVATGDGSEIMGTKSLALAQPGLVGELIQSASGNIGCPIGAVNVLTSITLTPGDWDVWCGFYLSGGTASGQFFLSISDINIATTNTPSRCATGYADGTGVMAVTVGPYQRSVTSNTVQYALEYSAAGITNTACLLSARRRR